MKTPQEHPEAEFSRVPKVRVKLPIPDPDVIGMTEEETVRMRYLESIEKIAELESKTLIEIQKMNNRTKMKIALILAGVIMMAGASILKLKIEGKCGETGVSIEPQKKEQIDH